MSEEHKIRTRFIPEDEDPAVAEQTKEDKHAKMQANFEWSEDIDQEECKAELPNLIWAMSSVNECATALSAHLLEHLGTDNFEISPEELVFSVPVDPKMHSLLEDRFNEDYDIESRIEVFDVIQSNLITEFLGAEKNQKLNAKIEDALPPSRKKFTLNGLALVDDAFAIGTDVNTVAIEVYVQSEAI